MKVNTSVNHRLRQAIHRLSNFIGYAITSAVFLWVSPGSELLREVGFQDDLIRATMLLGAVFPALGAGLIIRMLIAIWSDLEDTNFKGIP